MQQILDLHIHSKYSRACSPQLTLENIAVACRSKGVDIVATGDFTYPAWFSEIKNKLAEIPLSPFIKGGKNSGLYKLKTDQGEGVKFILSTELALIYKKGDRVRRIHLVVHAPSIKAVEELNKFLGVKYNISSDGRPILGMSATELVKLCLAIDPNFLIYPAHIWTPWFSVFGSKSGFDKLEECFDQYTENIYAIETGLSSDPAMNWQLSALDKLTILSNSDAHSLPNIGREANVLEMRSISYGEIYEIIKNKKVYYNGKEMDSPRTLRGGNDNIGIKYTIEFYPEEGMYHLDGHRLCCVSFTPAETRKHQGICPVCKKPLVIGVMNRVAELADRPAFVPLGGTSAGKPVGLNPPVGQAKFVKLVELDKIIAEALAIKSRSSTKVQLEYNNLIKQGGNELNILLNIDLVELQKMTLPEIVEGIKRVRQGELIIEPGFDGQYGVIKIFNDKEKVSNKQTSLF
ncbi:DNA helicase UvrD [Candidatus Falkowbacteria bacterium CG_4_9_14_3_um_filter_38_19]|uniref:DNA helicase UvrD n=2 Tax=Candidatus Falkowiibacteriota TaxID=1752728 RepID=A0A2M6WRS6_9BACT|nr:DNA helicase UvrD [Candidatus Falkowbacteria bacterium]PIT95491.1 MAG: DNA helicase UvrD [Candidatus Falkowbacteria bacterium CG10_big_fil_rev_8_21_14_0_10_38_22]PJB16723.1 MAG: DNA helicase UvrD [Candidatus Falkowbacteria bacterium CG_4_9_14_3_um_filter_38_19]